MKPKYNIEILKDAVKKSLSYGQTLNKLGMIPAGGNYFTVKKYIKLYNIDTMHFKGHGWNKGNIIGSKRPITDYLVVDCPYHIKSHALKERLIKEGILIRRCNKCELTRWLDKLIPLELHHKNGKHEDNRLENLELLCPNCHTFTDGYRKSKSHLNGS